MTSSLPIDFHCHGVGRFDFSDLKNLNLDEIEYILESRQIRAILTIYITKNDFNSFINFMESFSQQKSRFNHIIGIAVEGPLLASIGGTPSSTCWLPTMEQWSQLAKCGKKGLIYNVMSPYFSSVDTEYTEYNPIEIAELLLENGVFPAPGHFPRCEPEKIANNLLALKKLVVKYKYPPIISDHLYNDMPKNFKHAWRSVSEMKQRENELNALGISSWNLDNLEEKLGLVPATLIRMAREGCIKLCQNFDGEHVDLDIVKKTVELAGVENIILMTDSIESKTLAGQRLHNKPGNHLLYQEDDVVAAGNVSLEKQLNNMRTIGLSDNDIKTITVDNPSIILKLREKYIKGKEVETHYI